MYFIRAVEGDECLVVNTKTKEKRWFSSQTILNRSDFILGKSKGTLRAVSDEDVFNYHLAMLKLSGKAGAFRLYKNGSGAFVFDINIFAQLDALYELTDFEIPYGVTHISNYCFVSFNNLQNVVIPDTVVSIGRDCFNDSKLRSIDLPSSLKFVMDDCFSSCKYLKTIVIPDTVEFIGSRVCFGCSSLESITLPAAADSRIFDYDEVYNFYGCDSLKVVYVSKRSPLKDEGFPKGLKIVRI